MNTAPAHKQHGAGGVEAVKAAAARLRVSAPTSTQVCRHERQPYNKVSLRIIRIRMVARQRTHIREVYGHEHGPRVLRSRELGIGRGQKNGCTPAHPSLATSMVIIACHGSCAVASQGYGKGSDNGNSERLRQPGHLHQTSEHEHHTAGTAQPRAESERGVDAA